MRQIERTEIPDCLREHAAEWTDKFVRGRQENPKFKFQWYQKATCYHGEAGIRARLNDMTQQHCAFCDGPIGLESLETVEHFRPKKPFPELAYSWDNLFPACTVCQCKGEKFDQGLLKPDAADYSFNRYFINNYDTGAIEPNPFASAEDQQCAVITLDLYSLNSERRMLARRREAKFFRLCAGHETPEILYYRFFLQDEVRNDHSKPTL